MRPTAAVQTPDRVIRRDKAGALPGKLLECGALSPLRIVSWRPTVPAVCARDEFQELGFELTLNFKADLSDKTLDDFVDQFLDQAIAGNGLDYVGGEDFGLVCLAKRGSVNEEQRAAVEAWLKGRNELEKFELSPLQDVWYPENPINQA